MIHGHAEADPNHAGFRQDNAPPVKVRLLLLELMPRKDAVFRLNSHAPEQCTCFFETRMMTRLLQSCDVPLGQKHMLRCAQMTLDVCPLPQLWPATFTQRPVAQSSSFCMQFHPSLSFVDILDSFQHFCQKLLL